MNKTIKLFLALWLACCSSIMAQEKGGGLGGRTFVYGDDVKLPNGINISDDDTRPLNVILDHELAGTGIGYRITKAHVVLFNMKAKEHTIYGYVVDAQSKESLIGANVYIPDYLRGNTTNSYGHFNIIVPEGNATLRTSYIGYNTDVRTINVTSDTLITVALESNTELAEVVVDADRPDTGLKSTRSGAVTVPVNQIMRTPAVLGEADVIKALHLLPGVQSAAAGQVSMSVRGGNTDQNLFLLDGMPMYNVDHVLGFESAFMADAVKHVDFYRNSFSARYGGRLSSVTDVRTKDGDMQQRHGTISVGLLTSHLSYEAPIWKDRTSFIVSARRSYLDWILKPMTDKDIDLNLYFYDLNAKINHKVSDNDRLYLSFYSGRDALNLSSTHKYTDPLYSIGYDKTAADIRWGNTLYQARWNHIFSPRLFANIMMGYNKFKLSCESEMDSRRKVYGTLEDSQSMDVKFCSDIDDLSTAIDFDFHPQSQHRVRMGAQYTLHTFRPEVQSSHIKMIDNGVVDINESLKSGGSAITAHESAIYAEDDAHFGNWQVNAGMRAVMLTTDGKSFPNIEPRLSLCRSIGDHWRLKAAYTLMHQYVHRLQSSQIATPSDLWVPVTKNMKPMGAYQYSIGICADRWEGWEFTAETYYKRMSNVIDFIDGATFNNSKGWEEKIATGKGQSYGIELNLAKTQGRTTGMLNYTLAKTERWYPDGSINGGKHFPYRYDRRHVVHLLVQHQLNDRIDLNASWNFASGALASVAKQQTLYIEPTVSGTSTVTGPYISARNNYRLKPTHQLDLSVSIHRTLKRGGERIWNFSLINAYCHLNQDMLYTDLKEVDNGDGTYSRHRVMKQLTIFPFVPSASYTYKF